LFSNKTVTDFSPFLLTQDLTTPTLPFTYSPFLSLTIAMTLVSGLSTNSTLAIQSLPILSLSWANFLFRFP
jgi:hypothetical protein